MENNLQQRNVQTLPIILRLWLLRTMCCCF